MTSPCLTDLKLEAYHAGDLAAEETGTLSSHLQACPACHRSYSDFLSNQDLLGRVRRAAQLAGTDRPSSLFDFPPGRLVSQTKTAHIRGYRIIRELQRGGQGVVYEATQLATKRRVALKVLLETPLSDPQPGRRRFEAEIELAAGLKHSHIVPIFDSGLIEGQFYYAMAYIEGMRLDDYVKSKRLSIVDTIKLFRKICTAVRYAHQHGVIHRDLKPSNIRVDNGGEPHLLDFGLAKRTQTELTSDDSAMTKAGHFMGTLAYAAPEQTHTASSQVGTPTDVYALGVMLYELLTAQYPYPVQGRIADVFRHIAETEPKRPRAIEAGIDSDLEAIILKALQKEPSLRYQTAGHLEDDLNRYLRGDAVEAKRATTLYVVGKLMRRHRAGLAAAAGIAVAFLSLASWHWWSITLERDKAVAAQARESQARLFLQGMFTSVQPIKVVGQNISILVDMLDEGSGHLDESFGGHPLVEAALRTTIGNTYRNLGLYDKAEPHLRQALAIRLQLLGDEHSDVARSMNALAMLLKDANDFDEAEQLQRTALHLTEQLGDEHPDIVTNLNDLGTVLHERGEYTEAEKLYHQALETGRALFGAQHAEIASILNNLASLSKIDGDYAGAEARYRESLELYGAIAADDDQDHDADRASTMNNLAVVRKIQGDFAEAEALYRTALALRQATFGNDHVKVAESLDNLGTLLSKLGQNDKAEPLHREALAIRRKWLGESHLDVAGGLNNLARLLSRQGNHEEAEELLRESLTIHRQRLGDEHLDTATVINNIGVVALEQGQFEEAQRLLTEALDTRRRLLGEPHKDVAMTMNNLAGVLRKQGDYEGAEGLYREALTMNQEVLGSTHPAVADNLNNLALTLKHLGAYNEAEQLYTEALQIYQRAFGEDHPRVAGTRKNLANLLKAQNR